MKVIRCLLCVLLGLGAGIIVSRREALKALVISQNELKRNVCLFRFTNEWLSAKQRGINIEKYLMSEGYQTIAVYGMGYLGERFVDELSDSGINIQYAIDRCKTKKYANIDIREMDEELPDVNAVVVTAICDFEEIRLKLKKRLKCPIISLEDIVYR